MDKIREFLKKNGVFVLLGAIIGVLLLYLILQRGGIIKKSKIESPFVQTYDFQITVPNGVTGFSEEVPVLKAEIYDPEVILELAENLSGQEIDADISEQSVVWFENDQRGNFNKSVGVASFIFDKGTKLDVTSDGLLNTGNAGSYFEKFKDEYLDNLPDVEIDEIYENDGNISISGYYIFDEYPEVFVSSMYIGNYAFEIEFSEFGDLNSISILMIKEVESYETLPTMNSSEISKYVGLSSFPKEIGYDVMSDGYDELAETVKAGTYPVSAEFEEFSILWSYVGDGGYSYIVPIYHLTGNGIVQNPFDDTHEATMEMYFCAIDPEYIVTRESEAEDINFGQDLSEDENIEEPNGDDDTDRYLFDPVGGQPEGL